MPGRRYILRIRVLWAVSSPAGCSSEQQQLGHRRTAATSKAYPRLATRRPPTVVSIYWFHAFMQYFRERQAEQVTSQERERNPLGHDQAVKRLYVPMGEVAHIIWARSLKSSSYAAAPEVLCLTQSPLFAHTHSCCRVELTPPAQIQQQCTGAKEV